MNVDKSGEVAGAGRAQTIEREKIHGNVLALVGNTPLVRLPRLNDTHADLVAKLEFDSPPL